MTTPTTTRKTSKPIPATEPQPEAQPQRPAIYLQIVLPDGASQPVGVALDTPDWERQLGVIVQQLTLIAYRWQVGQMKKGGSAGMGG